jgi:Methyltransferase domain
MVSTKRVNIFYALLEPFSNFTRGRRMALFERIMQPTSDMKILDLGGQPMIWDSIKTKLNITCINLPGIAIEKHPTHHNITFIEGDACNMPQFKNGDFDLIFSNSVIEHVGDVGKRSQFSNEVQRLTNKYWIQTPYKYYPIEAHSGMLFWWLYPQTLRDNFIKKWRNDLPAWTEMVETTDIVEADEFKQLFPKAKFTREWIIFPKSQIAYSV